VDFSNLEFNIWGWFILKKTFNIRICYKISSKSINCFYGRFLFWNNDL